MYFFSSFTFLEVMNNERMQNGDEQKSSDDNISKQIEFHYSSNSHDSLLQSDHQNIDPTTTARSSIDDLTRTNQFLSSTFHSKDSALGLSDDNLNHQQLNELIIQEQQQKIPSLITFEDTSKFHFLF